MKMDRNSEEPKKNRHYDRFIVLFLFYSIVLNIFVLPMIWGANLQEAFCMASSIMKTREAVRDPNVIVDATNQLIIYPINRIVLDSIILVLYFAPALWLAIITEIAINEIREKSTK